MNGISPSFRLPGSLLMLAALAAPAAQPPKPRQSPEWLRARHAATAGVPAAGLRAEAVRQLNEMLRARPAAGEVKTWQLIGPQPTVTTLPAEVASGAPLSSGRITAMVVDPRDAALAYAGTAMGGVWKTADAGKQWTPLTDDQVSLAIGSLALDPAQPDTIYAGTGEANFSGDNYYGAGILKSTDAGRTWSVAGAPILGPLNATHGGAAIGALAVHRLGRIVLAGVASPGRQTSGIWRSADAGATWLPVLMGAPGTAVIFDPSSPNLVYAALGDPDGSDANGIYRSSDAGATWKLASAGIDQGSMGRVSLAVSKGPLPRLFAAVTNSQGYGPLGVYISRNNAGSWEPAKSAKPGYCYGACFYTNTIQVHPFNPNLLIAAGEGIFISYDGGDTWTSANIGSNGVNVHADVHALAFSGDGTRLYVGSDGGVVAAERLGSTPPGSVDWHNLNDTLALAQFYPGCSQHPENSAFMVCGTQDNGVQVYTGGEIWQTIYSGDGGYTAIDDAEPTVYYVGNSQAVDIQRTAPFGTFHGLYAVTYGLPFDQYYNKRQCSGLPPLATDPAHPLRMYWGCWQLYQTEDGGSEWTAISPSLLKGSDDHQGYIQAIAVTPSDSGRVYIGTSKGKVQTTASATAGANAQWADVSGGLPPRMVTAIAVDPLDAQVAYAVYAGFSGFDDRVGHVFSTVDAGAHWTDISGNLPNIPVNAIALDAAVAGAIYIGTDVGVFVRQLGVWQPVGPGLPRVPVLDLKIQQPFRLLRAATHGRSMWEYQLAPASTGVPSSVTAEFQGGSLLVAGMGISNGATVRWNGAPRPTVTTQFGVTVALDANDAVPAGRASVVVCNPGRPCSHAYNVDVGGAPTITAAVNNGNPAAPRLAPGTIASIYGANLSPAEVGVLTMPMSLAGTTVEIHDSSQHLTAQAPLLHVSPGQIDFVVPASLDPNDSFSIGVVNGTRLGSGPSLQFSYFSPAIFAALPVSTTTVQPGGVMIMLASGLGPTYPDGSGAQVTYTTPAVTIGGIPATVGSSVLSALGGLYLVSVTVPATLQPGVDIPVVLTTGGVTSNTLSIHMP